MNYSHLVYNFKNTNYRSLLEMCVQEFTFYTVVYIDRHKSTHRRDTRVESGLTIIELELEMNLQSNKYGFFL